MTYLPIVHIPKLRLSAKDSALVVSLIGLLLLLVFGTVGPLFTNLGYVGLARLLLQPQNVSVTTGASSRWFERSLALHGNEERAILGLGKAYLAEGRPTEAIAAFRSDLLKTANQSRLRLALGDALYRAGEQAAAVEEWRLGDSLPFLLQRGVNAQRTGDLPRAAEWLTLAIAVDPDHSDAYAALGEAKYGQHEVSEAIKYYTQAVALSPDNTSWRHRLGTLHMSAGNAVAAITEFEEVIRRQPDEFWTNLYLASLYQQAGRSNKAQTAARRALRSQNHPRLHYVLGLALLAEGLKSDAIDELATALRLIPIWNESSSYPVSSEEGQQYAWSLAELYEQEGRTADAVEVYRAMLRQTPDDTDVAAALDRLGAGQ